jgi:hypothetical protein
MQVERLAAQRQQEERKNKIIEEAGSWLKGVLKTSGTIDPESLSDDTRQYIEILRSFHLFGKESKNDSIARALIARAGSTDCQGGN